MYNIMGSEEKKYEGIFKASEELDRLILEYYKGKLTGITDEKL